MFPRVRKKQIPVLYGNKMTSTIAETAVVSVPDRAFCIKANRSG